MLLTARRPAAGFLRQLPRIITQHPCRTQSTTPGSTIPESTIPESAVAEPAVNEPVVADSAVAESVVAEPAVTEPAVAESVATKPAVAQPVVAESTPSKPEPDLPSVHREERVHHSQLPIPRLDYARLVSDPEATKLNAALRNVKLNPDHVDKVVEMRRLSVYLEHKLNEARALHANSSSLYRDVKKKREKKDLLKDSRGLKSRVKALDFEFKNISTDLYELADPLPNWSHKDAPVGPEKNAVEVERFGPEPIPELRERDHVTIAKQFGWLDTSASTVAVGASWPYLVGAFAQLEHALVNYALTIACKHGYTPVSPPNVVIAEIAKRCGFHPRDGEDGPRQTYFIEGKEYDMQPDLCLTGTAEIPLAAMVANKTLYQAALPTRVVGVGRAYRAEAGARGLDTRGLYRVHEFTKVELFSVTGETESDKTLEEIRAIQKEVAEGLGLSVRVLDMPTEELGAAAARKYDMEAWMPGRGKWGEISSASNCTDYQSRRLHIKYRDDSGSKPKFAHTLNGTAAAIPRLIVALIENGAVIENGLCVRVELPKALEKYWIGCDADGVIRFV